MAKPLSANDPSSFSNPDQVIISHLHLILNVQFSDKVLKGSAILDLAWITDSNEKLLVIFKISFRNKSNFEIFFFITDP